MAFGTELAKRAGMAGFLDDQLGYARTRTRTRTRRRLDRVLTVWCLFLLLAFGAAVGERARADDEMSFGERWRPLKSVGGRGVQPSALAQSESGGVAIADEAGISWWRDEIRQRAALPLVRDLAFDADGVLWIATLDGLYSWRDRDRPKPRRLLGGESANRVHRIAVSRSALLIATEAGGFWSSHGKIFQPLNRPGAATAVSQVAIRAPKHEPSTGHTPGRRLGETQAWLFGAGRLSLIRGFQTDSGIRVTGLQDIPLPRPADAIPPVDLVIDPSGTRVFLVFADVIAWRSTKRPQPVSAPESWQIERPQLPPGAVMRRIAWAADRIWVATDHGLLAAENWGRPFRRAASPVGTTECFDIQPEAPDRALALCRSGLFVLESRETSTNAIALAEAPIPALSVDPPLTEIRRRALIRAGLTARTTQSLWDRLRRRAFWPEVALRFDASFDYDDSRDSDQAFVSGDTRHLRDSASDEGREYSAAIAFDWDLGGVVYPLESVDLSRELRQVVSLRDDVADEINQLYFERQAIRERLESADGVSPSENAQLRWRARELDAGLDSWTGGWISRWRADRRGERAADSGLRPTYSDPVVYANHPDLTNKRK